ncbi:MAG: hypothetical protein U0559_07260 [Anaerolineae bacterium]
MTPEIRFMMDAERRHKANQSKDYGSLAQTLARWLKLVAVLGVLAFALIASSAAATGATTLMLP